MRRAFTSAAILALAACAQPTVDSAAAEKAVLAVNAAYDQALIDGNAAALDRFYHDDFTIIDGNGTIHDKRDQIAFMTQSIDMLDGKGEDVRVNILGPDTAFLTGRFVTRYQMDGKEADSAQRFTALYVREGGEWRIRHEHVSNLPQPGAPPVSG